MAMVVDVVNSKAGIPGSGDVPVAMTFTSDLAKFVATALTLPKWEQETYLTGDKLTWNQLVELIEAVKGVKSPYPYISDEQLQPMIAISGLMFERGVFDLRVETSIMQDFPDLKLRSMKELLEEAYKLKV
ncbi:uncharacterized protein CCOS01_06275 [Colletotrichum costaricense]|uniref:NmrA-like domain-containing protein n=1 Tax=Colletotrichum costaricense TaxID=1209916 RepID=A0AAI9YZ34_9PEZI|nr:uncharacterized protein CCOS01_06275 [Colletotrichum costaricense]KAI3538666.1 hypothetical protein CSPX01_09410 [Colletotrichum filicis]KAK1528441.1 hypothetical protein CCOS01_06275 [Colletotrichum costaricense]